MYVHEQRFVDIRSAACRLEFLLMSRFFLALRGKKYASINFDRLLVLSFRALWRRIPWAGIRILLCSTDGRRRQIHVATLEFRMRGRFCEAWSVECHSTHSTDW
jgi:hypothetical protein